MSENLEKIQEFISQHHVMSLATRDEENLSVCSLFYYYDVDENVFIVASSSDTTHIKHTQKYPDVAANIVLETDKVGDIQGLQIRGVLTQLDTLLLKAKYFKQFPYALAMQPKLWKIRVNYFKLTDNRLGFGKKLIWQEASL